MVHIVSILNLTRYKTQVNRQWINIILKELTKSNEDIRALFNITNQLATQQMLYQIESELPPNMHLPIPSSDPLHFYRYLQMHVLVEENQFLLLIDISIQDRAQQIQIYQIINLPVPVAGCQVVL